LFFFAGGIDLSKIPINNLPLPAALVQASPVAPPAIAQSLAPSDSVVPSVPIIEVAADQVAANHVVGLVARHTTAFTSLKGGIVQ